MAIGQAGTATGRHVVLLPVAGADVNATDRRVAYWLTGVSALVLAVGLANAATLLLVRASRRRREFAIRYALGASSARLLREIVAEAVAVSIVASLLSLLLASWFDGVVRRVLLPGVAPVEGVTPASVLTALAAGCVAAIVATMANASNLAGGRSHRGLDDELRSAKRRPALQTGLLVLQTALSVVLLAGAGLFGRSLFKLLAQDFGMNMDGVVLVDFEMGPGFVPGQDDVFRSALERVRSLPGVREATVIRTPPFAGFTVPPIAVPGRPGPPNVDQQLPYLHAATPEFLDILGVRIVSGRGFTAADEHAPVVIVNESMARGVWPGENPIGKCIRIGFDPDFDPATATGPPTPSAKVPCREVVGVAHDIRQRSVVPAGSEDKLMQYFVPFSQVPVPPFIAHPGPRIGGLMLKADVDPASLAPAIRRIVTDGRPDLPYVRVRPYSQLLEPQMRPWTLGTWLLGLFSALAVAVGAVGLYAAFSHAVLARRREMAIRLAIGAQPRRVLGMVIGESLTLGLTGVCCGAVAAAIGGRYLRSLLYDTGAADPLVLGSAAAIMLGVAAAATLVPARTASRVDPATLLRVD